MDQQDQQLAALAAVSSLLEEHRIDYWLFGGWAVDFHAGTVTRRHMDIDFAVWANDAEAIHSLLTSNGWEHAPDAEEDGGTGYEGGGVRFELTYLTSSEDGEVFIVLRDRNALWSERPLGDDVLALDGKEVRVVSLELLIGGKSSPRDDPEEAEVDRKDFETLSRLIT